MLSHYAVTQCISVLATAFPWIFFNNACDLRTWQFNLQQQSQKKSRTVLLFLSLPIFETGTLKVFQLKFILTIKDWPVFGSIWEGY